MCPIGTEETLSPVPDWDPNEAWREYLRKYPALDGMRVYPEEEKETQALKDESIGTGCLDPYHQDHLCCAGPAGKTGVLNIRPNDISYIQHCLSCMLGNFFSLFFLIVPYAVASSSHFIILFLRSSKSGEFRPLTPANQNQTPQGEEGSINEANMETICS